MVKKGGKRERSMAILHYIPVKLAKLLKPDLPQIATSAIRSLFLMTLIIPLYDASFVRIISTTVAYHSMPSLLSASVQLLRLSVGFVSPCRVHARDQMKAPSSQSTQQSSQPSTSSVKTKNVTIKKLEADVVDIRGTCSSIANDVQQMSAILNSILAPTTRHPRYSTASCFDFRSGSSRFVRIRWSRRGSSFILCHDQPIVASTTSSSSDCFQASRY